MRPTAFALILSLTFTAFSAGARNQCRHVFGSADARVVERALHEWLAYEQRGNDPSHQQPDRVVLPTKKIPRDRVNVDRLDDVPEFILADLIHGNDVTWVTDPTNVKAFLPFANEPVSGSMNAHFTMSRSKAVVKSPAGKIPQVYSLKMPTDNPQKGENKARKADLRMSVKVSMSRARLVQAIDRRIGADPRLIVLKDVMAISDKGSGNGFVVRDLTPLTSGHVYVPQMSTPFLKFVGDGPAYLKHVETEARETGVLKALMLVRYGLEMTDPHGQNILTEYGAGNSPTGVKVVRDLSDTVFVDVVADVIAPEALRNDRRERYDVQTLLDFNYEKSAYHFIKYDRDRVTPEIFARNEEIHDRAYFETVEKELRVRIPLARSDSGPPRYWRSLHEFLKTEDGRAAVRAYHDRLSAAR